MGCIDNLETQGMDANASFRSKLQSKRSKLNQEINKELRLRAGAEKLYQATTNKKLRNTIQLELSFVNSNLQLLKEQLAELNSSVECYQNDAQNLILPMIPLGLKETKEIGFMEPFSDFILEHYSEDSNLYEDAIADLTDLRQACRTPTRDTQGVSLLFRYYNLLYYVERRFFTADRNAGIYFEWYDSLTGEPSSQRSVAYEKACILFNLAAIYTQIGARHDRKSEKGLDGAVYSFLQAAGVFKHIYDTFTNAPSMDLKPLVLDVFVDLMLAQSRECLYEKLQLQIEVMSIQDADTLYKDLAGEANQLAKKYAEIHTTIQSNETHSYLPECWVGLVPMKAEYYKGLAHFHAAKAAGEGVSQVEGYPADKPISDDLIRRAHLKEAIASLEEARRIQRMCRDLKNKDGLSKVVKEALSAAEDEFAVIDRIIPDNVNDDDLVLLTVKIEAISNVTLSLTGPDFTSHKVEDPFKGLGPIGVFSARKYWTAPRSIRLQKGTGSIVQKRKPKTCHCKPGTLIACDYCKSRSNNGSVRSGSTNSSGKERVIESFGFNVRGDAPVVISHVETNSLAELGCLKQGDYIVEIMGVDVKWYTYQQVVKLINSAHASLELKVVTPMDKGYQSPIPKDPYCPYTYQSLGRHSTSSSMLSSTRTSNSDTTKSQKTKSCSKRSRSRLNSFTASSWNLFRRSQSMGKI